MNNVYRGAECPTCGYMVYIYYWQEVELESKKNVSGFCDMCETYLNFKDEDGKLVAHEC